MDKATLLMAEQVGFFLAPMMRTMIATAFKEANLSARLDALNETVQGALKSIEQFEATHTEVSSLQGTLRTLTNSVNDWTNAINENMLGLATLKDLDALTEQRTDDLTKLSASLKDISSQLDAQRTRIDAVDIAGDDNRKALIKALEEVQAEFARVEAIKAAPVELPRVPTIEQVAVAARELVREDVDAAVRQAVAALPPAKDGEPGPVGVLPVVEDYIDGVVYERGAAVLHAGGTWQATRRTKSAPGADAAGWQALAVGLAGMSAHAGPDGRSFELRAALSNGKAVVCSATTPALVYRGVFDGETEYAPGDVVTHDGSMWHTDKTTTGSTPTQSPDVWKLAVKCGRPGAKGKDGVDGTHGVQFKAGYAGEYEEDKVYPQNSIVTYASSIWLSKRPTKERPPYLTGADSEHWLRVR